MKNLVIVALFLFSLSATAQQYNSAIGVRGGLLNSITYKKSLSDISAAEGILSSQFRGLMLTGLYMIQNPLDIEGEHLEWYYGGGAHVGFSSGRRYRSSVFDETFESTGFLGVDGVVGLEYTFSELPVNIAMDYKPSFDFLGYTGFWFNHVSVAIRYVID